MALFASIQVDGVARKGWVLVIGASLLVSIIGVSCFLLYCWVVDNYQEILPRLFNTYTIDDRTKMIFNGIASLYIVMQFIERLESNSYHGERFSLLWLGLLIVLSSMFVLLDRGYKGMRITLILLLLISAGTYFEREPSGSYLLNNYGTAILVIEIILMVFLVFFKFPYKNRTPQTNQ